jgi:hypothetical protein
MRMKHRLHIINVLTFIFILCFCNSKEKNKSNIPWEEIIKEFEIVLSVNEPDSIKYFKLNQIFKNYQIDISDYREFYNERVNKNPEKNIQLYETIENLLSNDMKEASKVLNKFPQRGQGNQGINLIDDNTKPDQ